MTASWDRREFVHTTGGTLGLLLSRSGLSAAQAPQSVPPSGPQVTVGVIGLGTWGRALGRVRAA